MRLEVINGLKNCRSTFPIPIRKYTCFFDLYIMPSFTELSKILQGEEPKIYMYVLLETIYIFLAGVLNQMLHCRAQM